MSSFSGARFTTDTDRRVKVYVDDVAVVASNAEIEYARPINLIGDRFTVAENVLDGVSVFDISLTYADKTIPYEGGVAQGSTPGFLDFNDAQFDVAPISGDKYVITSTGRVKVNAISTIRPLSVINDTGNQDAVTVTDNPSASDQIELKFKNNQVEVFQAGVQVGDQPRRLNFDSSFTTTAVGGASDWVTVSLADTGDDATYLPDPTSGQYGILRWGSDDAPSKEGIFSFAAINDVGDGTRDQGDDSDGIFVSWMTGGDDNDYIEMTTNADNITDFTTRRDYNPHLYGKVKITGSSFRMFIGFHNNEPLALDNNSPIGSNSGFGFSYSTDGVDSGNYQIRRNDGSGSEAKTSMGVAFSSGTLVSFHIWGNSSGWFWSINGGAASSAITTDVPAASTRMYVTARIEQIGDASGGETMKIYYIYYKADK